MKKHLWQFAILGLGLLHGDCSGRKIGACPGREIGPCPDRDTLASITGPPAQHHGTSDQNHGTSDQKPVHLTRTAEGPTPIRHDMIFTKVHHDQQSLHKDHEALHNGPPNLQRARQSSGRLEDNPG